MIATFNCRHCEKPDAHPQNIYDTSDAQRFDLRLCSDCWKKAQAEYHAALARSDIEMKPLHDALDASTRLTAEDFNITINARD